MPVQIEAIIQSVSSSAYPTIKEIGEKTSKIDLSEIKPSTSCSCVIIKIPV